MTAHLSRECLPAHRPADRSKKAPGRWIPAAVLAFALCAVILHVAEFPADGQGMTSTDGAPSYDSSDDDSSQDPLLAVPRFPFTHSGNNQKVFLSGTVRLPSLTIAPPAPPPKN
jgi:hypothetical protein